MSAAAYAAAAMLGVAVAMAHIAWCRTRQVEDLELTLARAIRRATNAEALLDQASSARLEELKDVEAAGCARDQLANCRTAEDAISAKEIAEARVEQAERERDETLARLAEAKALFESQLRARGETPDEA